MIDNGRAQGETESYGPGMPESDNVPPVPDRGYPEHAGTSTNPTRRAGDNDHPTNARQSAPDDRRPVSIKEARAEDRSPARAQSPIETLAVIAELAHEAVEPAKALMRALTLALPLLPEARALALYARQKTAMETAAQRGGAGMGALWSLIATADDDGSMLAVAFVRVLPPTILDHLTHASGAITYEGTCFRFVPGTSPHHGVLAVRLRDAAVSSDGQAILRLVSATLSTLLTRWAQHGWARHLPQGLEELAAAGSKAPPEAMASGEATYESRGAGMRFPALAGSPETQRTQVLQAAGQVLAQVIPSSVVLPLVADSASGVLREVSAATTGQPLEITDRGARILLAALAQDGVLDLSANLEGTNATTLRAIRDELARRIARQDAEEPVSLIIMRIGEAHLPMGVLALARWEQAPVTDVLAVMRLVGALAESRLAMLGAITASEEQARAFDVFLSLAAHELRSPLTSVKGYGQLLLRQSGKLGLPERVVRSAESIVQQSERLAEMIDELHDSARIRRNRLELAHEPVDLVAVTERIVTRLEHEYPRHKVEFARDVASAVGLWDAQRVAQCVRALVDNALRFSPEAGTVRVELRTEFDGKGANAILCVRDPGIGIPPQEREHIYSYLYRGPSAEKRNLAGLGLGLYVAHNTAQMLGGRLWLAWTSSEEAGGIPTGTEFCLALPLAPVDQGDHQDGDQ